MNTSCRMHHYLYPALMLFYIAISSFSVFTSAQPAPHMFQDKQAATINEGADSLQQFVPYVDQVKADDKSQQTVLYLLLIGLAALFSEELSAIGAGLMAAQNLVSLTEAAAAVTFGILFFDLALYMIGRGLGMKIFRVRPFSWFLKEAQIRLAVQWFRRRGPVVLLISRFVPGSRLPIYLTAGMTKTTYQQFLLYFGLPVVIWTPIFVWISKYLGNEVLEYYQIYKGTAWIVLLLLVIVLVIMVKYVWPFFGGLLSSHKQA